VARLNEEQQLAMLIEAHRQVEESADWAAKLICGDSELEELVYPPNGSLTEDEIRQLDPLRSHPEAVAATRKVVADAIDRALFRFFGLIDAVGNPQDYSGDWFPITLHMPRDDSEEEPEDLDPYQIRFSDSYWDWRAIRPDPGWKRDNWDGPDPIR
jgi:hypothetical protein